MIIYIMTNLQNLYNDIINSEDIESRNKLSVEFSNYSEKNGFDTLLDFNIVEKLKSSFNDENINSRAGAVNISLELIFEPSRCISSTNKLHFIL